MNCAGFVPRRWLDRGRFSDRGRLRLVNCRILDTPLGGSRLRFLKLSARPGAAAAASGLWAARGRGERACVWARWGAVPRMIPHGLGPGNLQGHRASFSNLVIQRQAAALRRSPEARGGGAGINCDDSDPTGGRAYREEEGEGREKNAHG